MHIRLDDVPARPSRKPAIVSGMSAADLALCQPASTPMLPLLSSPAGQRTGGTHSISRRGQDRLAGRVPFSPRLYDKSRRSSLGSAPASSQLAGKAAPDKLLLPRASVLTCSNWVPPQAVTRGQHALQTVAARLSNLQGATAAGGARAGWETVLRALHTSIAHECLAPHLQSTLCTPAHLRRRIRVWQGPGETIVAEVRHVQLAAAGEQPRWQRAGEAVLGQLPAALGAPCGE